MRKNTTDQFLYTSMNLTSVVNKLKDPRPSSIYDQKLEKNSYQDKTLLNPRIRKQSQNFEKKQVLTTFDQFKLKNRLIKQKSDNPQKHKELFEASTRQAADLFKTLEVLKEKIRQKSNSKLAEKYGDSLKLQKNSTFNTPAQKNQSNFLQIPGFKNDSAYPVLSPRKSKSPMSDRIFQTKTLTPAADLRVEEKLKLNVLSVKPTLTVQKQLMFSKSSRSIGQQHQLRMSDFKLGKNLGEGKFGVVYQAIHKDTNGLFALKKVKKAIIKSHMLEEQFMMQVKMQLYFNHSNILRLFGLFDDSEHIYLVLEYMEEGTLYGQLKRSGKFTEEEASSKMKDVVEGVKYLHNVDVAHRDIKPENIVISNSVCKLCDFGWSAYTKDNRRNTFCGTLDYSAPQILQGKQYGRAIDMWCIGVLAFELLVGKAPFYHISRQQTMKKIMNAELQEINIPNNLSKQAKDFISKLIVKDPSARMSADQALVHPFINNFNKG